MLSADKTENRKFSPTVEVGKIKRLKNYTYPLRMIFLNIIFRANGKLYNWIRSIKSNL